MNTILNDTDYKASIDGRTYTPVLEAPIDIPKPTLREEAVTAVPINKIINALIEIQQVASKIPEGLDMKLREKRIWLMSVVLDLRYNIKDRLRAFEFLCKIDGAFIQNIDLLDVKNAHLDMTVLSAEELKAFENSLQKIVIHAKP